MNDDLVAAVERLAQVSHLGRAWALLERVEAEVGPIPRRRLRRWVRTCKLVTAQTPDGETLVRLFVPRRPAPPAPKRPARPTRRAAYGLEGLELAAEVVVDRDLDGALFMLDIASRDRTAIRLGPERWAQVQLVERVANWAPPLLLQAAQDGLVRFSSWTSPGGRYRILARIA